jgi:hypothetical protein
MELLTALSSVEDPRRAQGRRVSLEQLLIMSILSYLCGHTGYRAMSRFSKAHASTLAPLLALKHPVPSHVTFFEVLSRIDQQQVIDAFNKWTLSFTALEPYSWVSADGKALGSTVADVHGEQQDFQAVVSFFAQQTGLVHSLEQYRNKQKARGEGELVRFLLSQLESMGAIISLDALHTQKKQLSRS